MPVAVLHDGFPLAAAPPQKMGEDAGAMKMTLEIGRDLPSERFGHEGRHTRLRSTKEGALGGGSPLPLLVQHSTHFVLTLQDRH